MILAALTALERVLLLWLLLGIPVAPLVGCVLSGGDADDALLGDR